MELRGLRHAGLTVTDLDRSIDWYGCVLGFAELFREEHEDRTAAVLRSGAAVVGLVRFSTTEGAFSPRHVGLDHLCFTARDREELDGWARHLDRCGVPHSGIAQMATGPILTFPDPDGIALAVSLPPTTEEEAE
jgi:catechol-2,3-dioxygenase